MAMRIYHEGLCISALDKAAQSAGFGCTSGLLLSGSLEKATVGF